MTRVSLSRVVLIAASGRADTSWKLNSQLIGWIFPQSAPFGQHSALEDESRDMHVESEGQQKSEGNFASAQRERFGLPHVEDCRLSRMPSACAADIATVRAEVDGTEDETRQTSASFDTVDGGAMMGLHFWSSTCNLTADVEGKGRRDYVNRDSEGIGIAPSVFLFEQ